MNFFGATCAAALIATSVHTVQSINCNIKSYICKNGDFNVEFSDNIELCWYICKSMNNCEWFSYSEELKDCFLFQSCPELRHLKDFVSSQVECLDLQNSKFLSFCRFQFLYTLKEFINSYYDSKSTCNG